MRMKKVDSRDGENDMFEQVHVILPMYSAASQPIDKIFSEKKVRDFYAKPR